MTFLIYGAIAAVIAAVVAAFNAPRRAVVSGLVAFVVCGSIGYFTLPTLSAFFVGNIVLVILALLIGTLISSSEYEPNKVGIGVTLAVFFGWLVIGGAVTTWSAFHSNSYRNLIGNVDTSTFKDDVSPVNIRQARVVNETVARRVGEKRLGEIPGLGSRVNLGPMNVQVINGCFTIEDENNRQQRLCFENSLVWAAPLEHNSVFRQWSNDSTEGYVLVSATDPSKVWLVTGLVRDVEENSNGRMGSTVSGVREDLALRYFTEGGYFGYNLKRHLRNNGYLTSGLADYAFEVRDDGRPFWVVTVYAPKVGFGGADATRVLTVDAQTGDIESYGLRVEGNDLADVPRWVDRIHPGDIVDDQLNNWGAYVNGWWNSLFGKKDVMRTTPGIELIFGADGRSYWYTGIQSAGAEQGTVGFMLVDTRTKQARWYRIAGATEEAAARAAEGTRGVVEAGYRATAPILYNVGGIASYFTTLHGDDGLPRMYAFINVEDYTIVGVGASPADALASYRVALSRQRGVVADDLVKAVVVEGEVADVVSELIAGAPVYFVRLVDDERREFLIASDASIEVKWTRPGHRVKLEIAEGEQATVNVVRFDNLSLKLVESNL